MSASSSSRAAAPVVADNRFLFVQDPPRLGNAFHEDSFLRSTIAQLIPHNNTTNGSNAASATSHESVTADLTKFGDRCVTSLLHWTNDCESNEPEHQPYDFTGARVDRVHTTRGWREQHVAAAQEGLIAIPYESVSPYARVHQFAKLLMYCPSSGMYSCPLAMTDGGARLMQQLLRDQHLLRLNALAASNADNANVANAASKAHNSAPAKSTGQFMINDAAAAIAAAAYSHLTSRAPVQFWTSGQWMTEQRSGSDVSAGTATLAVAHPTDGTYRLHGLKWFTSAVDASMAVTLARIIPAESADKYLSNPFSPELGKIPLSCFILLLRDPDTDDKKQAASAQSQAASGAGFDDPTLPPSARADGLNGIRVRRLKDKMGTRSLPTAELELCNTRALLLSAPGRGVSLISMLFNVTRLHNAVSALGYHRRMAALARDYAHRRFIFGRLLSANPLQVATLASIEACYRTQLRGVMELALLQGVVETLDAVAFSVQRGKAEATLTATSANAAAAVASARELFGLRALNDDNDGSRCVLHEKSPETLERGFNEALTALNTTFWPSLPTFPSAAAAAAAAHSSVTATVASAGEAALRAAALQRLMTPLAKLSTAKSAVANVSEGVEALGAMGYLEDSNIPPIIRNAQVLTIWEGTTNVCSHDVLRVLTRNYDVTTKAIIAANNANAKAAKGGAVAPGSAGDVWFVFESLILSRVQEVLLTASGLAQQELIAAAATCYNNSSNFANSPRASATDSAIGGKFKGPVLVAPVTAADASALPTAAAVTALAGAVCQGLATLRRFAVAARLTVPQSFAPLPELVRTVAKALSIPLDAATASAYSAKVPGVARMLASETVFNANNQLAGFAALNAASAGASADSNSCTLPAVRSVAAAAMLHEMCARELSFSLSRVYNAAASLVHASRASHCNSRSQCSSSAPTDVAAAWAVAAFACGGGGGNGGGGAAGGSGPVAEEALERAVWRDGEHQRIATAHALLGLDIGTSHYIKEAGTGVVARGWGEADPVTGALRATM